MILKGTVRKSKRIRKFLLFAYPIKGSLVWTVGSQQQIDKELATVRKKRMYVWPTERLEQTE